MQIQEPVELNRQARLKPGVRSDDEGE